MAWFVPFITGVGAGLAGTAPAAGTAGALTGAAATGATVGASIVPVTTVAGTLASGVLGGISAAKGPPKIPTSLDQKQSLLARQLAAGRTSRGEQGLSGSKLGDLTAAPVGKRTLLGG